MANILALDDDRDLCTLLKTALERDGHTVETRTSGTQLTDTLCRWADCILLDVMMPGEDGFAVCRRIRAETDAPILFLTARTDEPSVLTGLGLGADDYLTKPFAMGELLARLRSLTRRQEDFNRDTLQAGTVTLNCAEGELSSKSTVRLSPKETQLMKFFMQHPGKPCETRVLFDRIWQDEKQEDPGIVWIYVSYLREKLRAIGGNLTIDGHQDGAFVLQTPALAS